tara:strand:+ start:34 stop:696 length:663 start_codon:yes stop_codon:yes gene_type:complete
MGYWQNYNNKLLEFSNKLIDFNNNNQFNFIEKNLYNHIHDILILTILILNKKKEIRILDYGSNIVPWSNIVNKIDTENLIVYIFDPYSNKKSTKKLSKEFNVNIINSSDAIKNDYFDLLIFGSCSQYIKDFFDYINNYLFTSELILFTHTPLSKSQSFISNQYTDYKGKQNVRSFEKLIYLMKKNNYDLIFKSMLPPEFASIDNDKINETIYANLLFRKI